MFAVQWAPFRPLLFAAAGGDGHVFLYDLHKNAMLPTKVIDVRGKEDPVYAMSFNHKLHEVFAASDGDSIKSAGLIGLFQSRWVELDQLSVLMHGIADKEICDVDNVEFGIRLTKNVVELSRCQDGDVDRRGGCRVRFAQQRNAILLPILSVEDEIVVDPIGVRMGELM
ncbi:hypothetical protein CBR_g21926 [Chara braunii]|uniref:Uncharacterized protein n=1 Tax=Chara braunii TaxID=69332 RepID=A0A388L1K0_CHABU|nr:hypothetical protein CBR_g21926 [Chara braunii]|eukprot:GBG76177.1 hypothetical protein CBR_g21926 [Chara braunii]